jgi:ferredoxin-NADP reductase
MTAIKPPRPTAWRAARVVSIREETPRVKTIRFTVPDWPGHLPGQRVEVRLTADDGYRAERSYSIASPPEAPGLELTVDRIEAGEVSPFLTGELRPGDTIDLRGPIGGHFVWSAAAARRPLLLAAGGVGVAPLMCMLRHRRLAGSPRPAALLYSCRTRDDVVFHRELHDIERGDPGFALRITLTRESPPAWPGGIGRVDLPMARALVERLGGGGGGGAADAFVCGAAGFVEAAADLLVRAGLPAHAIRTERFGPTGT